MSLAAIVAAMAVPSLQAGLDRSRTRAAARFLAAQTALARAQAVGRAATVALRFTDHDQVIAVFADGNHNGVRTSDIESGRDPEIEPAVRLSDRFPGVTVDAASIGASRLLSLSPAGTATSGTIYLRGRDGARAAVRVFGATGRTRVLRYDPVSGTFDEGL